MSEIVIKIFISLAIGFVATRLANGLPELIRPAVNARVASALSRQGPQIKTVSIDLVMVCADFVASVGAIFGIGISILIELWKLLVDFGEVVGIVLIIATLLVVPITASVIRFDWINRSEKDYRAGLGKWLSRAVYGLSGLLVLLSGAGAIKEGYRNQHQPPALTADEQKPVPAKALPPIPQKP